MATKKKNSPKSSGKQPLWKRALRIVVYLFVASMLYVVVCRWVFPPITITQLSALFGGYGLKRDYVSWDEISSSAKLAAIASEDQLFPVHGGFDWKALEKSIEGKETDKRKKKKQRTKGAAASTITQQTAKNVFLWQGSGIGRYIRKAPEFFYTKAIEIVWGKKRILEVYLNVAEMGPGIFGIEAAAQAYFHKPASKLTTQEAAMIIACLPNPKKYTVVPASRRVKWRTPHIIRQMGHLQGDPNIQALLH